MYLHVHWYNFVMSQVAKNYKFVQSPAEYTCDIPLHYCVYIRVQYSLQASLSHHC